MNSNKSVKINPRGAFLVWLLFYTCMLMHKAYAVPGGNLFPIPQNPVNAPRLAPGSSLTNLTPFEIYFINNWDEQIDSDTTWIAGQNTDGDTPSTNFTVEMLAPDSSPGMEFTIGCNATSKGIQYNSGGEYGYQPDFTILSACVKQPDGRWFFSGYIKYKNYSSN
jgi:hypothetical protein